ncbi:cysteine--tRNA ligase [Desulfogranum japonicum]|uniref:cysteine--tRNA ligase n=1 Tax=Desulfogranum japonicum TaxID=231447 RepID=UPI00040A6548|nr:cysteine--tRNA ligase [Desulfogranum japonicum]
MKITELIGNTPLVELHRINPEPGVTLLGKLESKNPGGSIKDRVALSLVEAAERSGEMTREKILLEATSGNTGIGMAMVCAAKQFRCQMIMPESASIERRLIMQAYGAEIILTPASRATDGAIEKAYSLAREFPDLYFLADQYNNPANWMAHYNGTAPEIWEQTNGKVTDIIATLGTSGTAMGLSKWYRDHHPEVRVIAIEPYLGHKIQGLKNMKESYRPGIFDKTLPYEIVNVADDDAFETVRRLAAEEAVFAGMSGGAAAFAAIERAKQIKQGVVVVILPDGGERYLSTPLFVKEQKTAKEASKLRFYNTMSRKKEVFEPVNKKRVTLYSCGPTAYESPNVAHLRRLVVSDLIVRYLRFRGYTVESFMNFTDLDDNTIAGAEQAGLDLKDFTGRFIQEFHQAAEMLAVLPASGYPLASEHVGDMIEIAHDLIHRGYAYEKHGSIYFDISKFKQYGRLSRVDLSKIRVGRTVDLDNYEKDNPRDFTLLKRSTLAELKKGIFFETDWGNVRPGWHIECSAMSTRYLGETIDLHTASQDLIFPHHENEIAIAESLTGKSLANYWVHSGLVLRDGKKMSQEADNIVTLKEILAQGFTARVLRFMFFTVHYRKPFHFSFRRLESAATALKRLDAFTRKLLCLQVGMPHPEVTIYLEQLEQQFEKAMDDDLNISGALGALFYFIKKMNPVLQSKQLDCEQKNDTLEILRTINQTLGILQLQECPLTPEIDKLIRQRERARQLKDWTAADSVREELLRQGVTVSDTVNGTIWEKTVE